MNLQLARRRFIKGAIFSGTAATSGAGVYLAANAQSGNRGMERLLSLTINGRTRRVDVPPTETLANTLLYRLNLTGTKIGCNRGECGACTVLIDGVPNYACSVLTHNINEKVADRNVWDFSLPNIAAAFKVENGTIQESRVVCGGVQATPKRLQSVEQAVQGKTKGAVTAASVAGMASEGALAHNGFKIPLLENLVKREISA